MTATTTTILRATTPIFGVPQGLLSSSDFQPLPVVVDSDRYDRDVAPGDVGQTDTPWRGAGRSARDATRTT